MSRYLKLGAGVRIQCSSFVDLKLFAITLVSTI